MILDPKRHPFKIAYKLMIGSIVPRPIAFVSTINKKGQTNLAPFSFFNGVCPHPPTLIFCPANRPTDGSKKDTLINIEKTKEFVVNIATEDIAERMNQCSGEYPYGESEFAISGLTPEPSQKVKAPGVKESPIRMECELNQVIHIGEGPGSGHIVIGTIVLYHVADFLLFDGKIDTQKLKPIGRLAGTEYCRTHDIFEMIRPKV